MSNVLACTGDWYGLYKDGKLIYQERDIDPGFIRATVGEYEERWDVDNEWLFQEG